MTDLAAHLHGCKVFSKLNLKKGYYQVTVRVEDMSKTAVITPFGLWEFLRMPCGLRNAGQSFQRLMDTVGAGLSFVFIYLDNILIASPDEESHLQHLCTILQKLRQHGLLVNLSKSICGQSTVNFWGDRVSEQGAEPLTKYLEAIQAFRSLGTTRIYRV
jgi:hypothetical protein